MYYNGSVENWKNLLAENELDKIEAMAARDKYLKENRSFDGGSSYSYSERRDTTWAKTQNYSRKAGIVGGGKIGLDVIAGGRFGSNLVLKGEAGYTGSSVRGDADDNQHDYVEFDYELNDGNSGTDFSVDIYKQVAAWLGRHLRAARRPELQPLRGGGTGTILRAGEEARHLLRHGAHGAARHTHQHRRRGRGDERHADRHPRRRHGAVHAAPDQRHDNQPDGALHLHLGYSGDFQQAGTSRDYRC